MTKSLTYSWLKLFEDLISNVAPMMNLSLTKKETLCKKEKMLGTQCFKNFASTRVIKNRVVWVSQKVPQNLGKKKGRMISSQDFGFYYKREITFHNPQQCIVTDEALSSR